MSIVSTSITEAAKKAEERFSEASIPSPRLDAEVLLAYAVGTARGWLHAHGNEELQPAIAKKLERLIERRLHREPIAYITGKKEFYRREFIVTPDVLVPRPETEELIDLVKAHTMQNARILDVGTGSGCIGITLKLESPSISMTVSDISQKALVIARKNAIKLGAKPLRYVASDLLGHWHAHTHPKPFDVIVANLPYVDTAWETSPETAHEPGLALYAEDSGLALIYKCIEQSEALLINNGVLALEADPEQHTKIIEKARKHGFEPLEIRGYALGFTKQRQQVSQ